MKWQSIGFFIFVLVIYFAGRGPMFFCLMEAKKYILYIPTLWKGLKIARPLYCIQNLNLKNLNYYCFFLMSMIIF